MATKSGPCNERRLNAQSALFKQLLLDANADLWDSYLESLEVRPESVWRAASLLTGEKSIHHPLRSPNGIVYSAAGKVEVFPNTMEKLFTVHRGVCDPGHSAAVADFISGYFSRPPMDLSLIHI